MLHTILSKLPQSHILLSRDGHHVVCKCTKNKGKNGEIKSQRTQGQKNVCLTLEWVELEIADGLLLLKHGGIISNGATTSLQASHADKTLALPREGKE